MSEENVKPKTPEIQSEQYDAFRDSLELLYIKGNRSGRLQFIKDWPGAAAHIFGEDLISSDQDGSGALQDVAAWEEAAENKRIKISGVLEECLARSVKDGALQKDYVLQVVNDLGYDIAVLIYSEDILRRVTG